MDCCEITMSVMALVAGGVSRDGPGHDPDRASDPVGEIVDGWMNHPCLCAECRVDLQRVEKQLTHGNMLAIIKGVAADGFLSALRRVKP